MNVSETVKSTVLEKHIGAYIPSEHQILPNIEAASTSPIS